MKYQHIIDAVDKTIKELCDEFQSHPTLFYTENDIVCYSYSLLKNNIPTPPYHDKDGGEHLLIHGEYPTPFRCDMGGSKFEIKGDNETTPGGGRYQRGHYDIVVLNPDFIHQHTYNEIKGQDYELYKTHVISTPWKDTVILYGMEFMYSRDALEYSRGQNREKGIDQFISKVIQDADKLVASKNIEGFMGNVKMLTFVKGSPKEICYLLKEKLSSRNEVILCFG
jgi:hypothetical protein